jgi:DegV family protein with EDD domain
VRLSSETTAVVLDSTADIPDPQARHPNWRLVPLYVRFGDDTFRDHVDLTPRDFYERLQASSVQPQTSQPTPADFERAFAELAEYERIVCVLISGKLSGTAESARLAAEQAGDGRVTVFDSRSVCGQSILAEAIQRRLDRGTDEQELEALVERFRREAGILFTVDTLDYLVRGGRVGKAAGLAGELLSVKPILAIRDGEVEPVKRVRGRAKSLAELEAIFRESTTDRPSLRIGVAHAADPAAGEDLLARMRAARPSATVEIPAAELGPVIGTHGGPGTLGVFWFDDEA